MGKSVGMVAVLLIVCFIHYANHYKVCKVWARGINCVSYESALHAQWVDEVSELYADSACTVTHSDHRSRG